MYQISHDFSHGKCWWRQWCFADGVASQSSSRRGARGKKPWWPYCSVSTKNNICWKGWKQSTGLLQEACRRYVVHLSVHPLIFTLICLEIAILEGSTTLRSPRAAIPEDWWGRTRESCRKGKSRPFPSCNPLLISTGPHTRWRQCIRMRSQPCRIFILVATDSEVQSSLERTHMRTVRQTRLLLQQQ